MSSHWPVEVGGRAGAEAHGQRLQADGWLGGPLLVDERVAGVDADN